MNVAIFVEPYGRDQYAARLYVKRADVSAVSHILLGVKDTKLDALRVALEFQRKTAGANASMLRKEAYYTHRFPNGNVETSR